MIPTTSLNLTKTPNIITLCGAEPYPIHASNPGRPHYNIRAKHHHKKTTSAASTVQSHPPQNLISPPTSSTLQLMAPVRFCWCNRNVEIAKHKSKCLSIFCCCRYCFCVSFPARLIGSTMPRTSQSVSEGSTSSTVNVLIAGSYSVTGWVAWKGGFTSRVVFWSNRGMKTPVDEVSGKISVTLKWVALVLQQKKKKRIRTGKRAKVSKI